MLSKSFKPVDNYHWGRRIQKRTPPSSSWDKTILI